MVLTLDGGAKPPGEAIIGNARRLSAPSRKCGSPLRSAVYVAGFAFKSAVA